MPADKISAIEVSFAIPVELTREQECRIADLIQEIAKANEPTGEVHWLCGVGNKPQLSQADARFLGKPVNPDTSETGEPLFDSSVLYLETHCRERFDDEPV